MTNYYLGADLGGTRTRVMIADENGKVIGFGEGGPGNHEGVGYKVITANLNDAAKTAFQSAGICPDQVTGSGFGVAGYDWPNEKPITLDVIGSLGLSGAIELVNDVELGILAGSPRLWGVAVVSGTGCNCRGWDEARTRFGRVTGGGTWFGEGAGAGELISQTSIALGRTWTGAGPQTALAEAFVKRKGVKDLAELLQELICLNIEMDAADAPLVFEVAKSGDPVALDIIRWAGSELGIMANAVIGQLQFEDVDFDMVLIGSMFDGSPLLAEEMKKVVHAKAPRANFIRLREPPVLGAVLLGMGLHDLERIAAVRSRLIETLPEFLKKTSI
jgi:N-acetylglucosamine kinase-like BadF-type ATPase